MSSSGSSLLKILEDGDNFQPQAAGSSSPLVNGLSQYPNGLMPSLRKRPSELDDELVQAMKRQKAEGNKSVRLIVSPINTA